MILPDYPIQSKDDDKLKRAPLAQKVADLVLAFKSSESFVVGIEGAWGAGKTSFINMVLETLGNEVYHFVFNPWNFSDQTSLLKDFFSSFSNIEPITSRNDLKSKLTGYAKKLSDYGFQSINLFGISFDPLQKLLNEPLSDIRDGLNKSLGSLEKKVVIVIDDIDRLDADETKLIFKLVKLTANFPNTVFLLAYDRNRVENRLTIEKDGFEGGEYLKKIVQVSFVLPEPDLQDLWQILFEDLDATIKAVYGEVNVDDKRWGNLFHAGLKNLFITIRDIKRFISSLRLDWSIVSKDDITPVDFIGIEAIRVFAPQFYGAMSANKHLFTATDSLYVGLSSRDDKSARETKYKELIELVPANIKQTIDEICKQLFPQFDFRTSYPHDWQQTWRKELRVCSEEKFDFYFRLGIPTGAVSEAELKAVIKTLDNQDNFLKNLKKFNEEKRLRKILSRLIDYLDDIDKDKIKTFILSLWQLEEEVDDKRFGIWDLENIDTLVSRLSYHSIKQKTEKGKRGAFIAELVKDSNVLYPAVKFAGLVVHEFEEKNKKPNEETLLEQTEIEELKSAISEKFNGIDKDNLKGNKHLAFLLFRWKENAGEAVVRNFIAELLKNKSDTATFLSAFVSDIFSQGMGDYVSTKKRELNKKSVEAIYQIDEIEKVVNSITDAELKNFNEQQKEAIELFKKPKKSDIFD